MFDIYAESSFYIDCANYTVLKIDTYHVPIVNGMGRVNPVSGDIMTPRSLTHFRMLVYLLTGSKMLSVKCLGVVAFHFLLNFLTCFIR